LSAEAHQEIRLATRLEAILYLKGQPVPLTEMVTLTNSDRLTVEDAMIELMSDYAHRDSALEVVETPLGYSLQLRSAYQNLIEDLIPAELGTGTLRTLAAIALKEPILQADLINLQVQDLVERGFVRKRKQNEGRSYWLEVTDKFHQYFEVDNLREQGILEPTDQE